jgi:hypothetical protein
MIFAKKLSKHFRSVCRSFPMGKWVHIPIVGKIGFLRNFLLYTSKIVFFDHTLLSGYIKKLYHISIQNIYKNTVFDLEGRILIDILHSDISFSSTT